jgi:hypothetical protein
MIAAGQLPDITPGAYEGAVVIDDEFASLIPAPAPGEVAQMQVSLLAFGCMQALILWQGHDILLDGYTRYRLCQKLGLPFRVIEYAFADREAAKQFIVHH